MSHSDPVPPSDQDARRDVQALLAELRDDDPVVRAQAAKVFGRMDEPSPEVIEALGLTLEDPEPMVRSVAAASLGRLGPAAAVATDRLVARLHDPTAPVRFWAADALSRMPRIPQAARAGLEALACDESPMGKSTRAAARRALRAMDAASS